MLRMRGKRRNRQENGTEHPKITKQHSIPIGPEKTKHICGAYAFRGPIRGHALGFSATSTFPVSRVKGAVPAFGNLVPRVTATITAGIAQSLVTKHGPKHWNERDTVLYDVFT